MKQLRIIFTILCAICIALLVPLGAIFGWGIAGICLVSAFLFFGLMLLCKQSQEMQEEKANADGDDNEPSVENATEEKPESDSGNTDDCN